MSGEEYIVRKWKFKDLKHYVNLLNIYYQLNKEDVHYSLQKEYAKRVIAWFLGLFAKKYRHRRMLFVGEYKNEFVGFLEYTNHKIGLHTGYLKNDYLNADQIHLYRRFHRHGFVDPLGTQSEKTFKTDKVIMGFINVTNLASIKVAERNGYSKFNKMKYLEAEADKVHSPAIDDFNFSVQRYKRTNTSQLYQLYLEAIPETLKDQIILKEFFFEFSDMDFLADKFMDFMTHVYVRRYMVVYGDQKIGFFRLKVKGNFIELSMVVHPDFVSQYLSVMVKFLKNKPWFAHKTLFAFVEEYQTDLVSELLHIGFEVKKEYWEIVKYFSKEKEQH